MPVTLVDILSARNQRYGDIGFTGSIGYAGSQGPIGFAGSRGLRGFAGSKGNGAGIQYLLNLSTVTADPGTGYFSFNNSTLSLVTEIYVNKVDAFSVSNQNYISTWDDSTNPAKGYLFISTELSTFGLFSVNSVTDNTTYMTVSVTYITGASEAYVARDYNLIFSRTGDLGYIGSRGFTGSKGDIGYTGSRGVTGFVGSRGSQGFTGSRGFTGSQGALKTWGVPKTSNYSAVDGDRFIANTSGGSFTVTLPTPTEGAYLQIADGWNWAINNLIIDRNGATIEGIADNLAINITNVVVEFIYDGSTWQFICSAGPKGPPGVVSDDSAMIYAIALSI